MTETWYKVLFKDNEAYNHISFKNELIMTLFEKTSRDFYLNHFIKVYIRTENHYINTYYCFPPDFHDICATIIAKYKGVPFTLDQLDTDIKLQDFVFAWK